MSEVGSGKSEVGNRKSENKSLGQGAKCLVQRNLTEGIDCGFWNADSKERNIKKHAKHKLINPLKHRDSTVYRFM
jgi:hypothetical protein